MELNLNHKCRTCLAENDAMLSLFEIYEHDLTLAMILQSCIATAEISENDGLPSCLCDNCVLVITQFYNFIVVFEDADKKLRSLVKQMKKETAAPINDSYKVEIVEQPEVLESETNELTSSDSAEQLFPGDNLNDIVAVIQVDNEDVNLVADPQSDFNLVEYKSDEMCAGEQQVAFDVQPAKVVFKKEVIPLEELEDVKNCNDEYLEIHLADDNDVLIKSEPTVFNSEPAVVKSENPLYEEITKYECNLCGEAHLYAVGFQQHMRVKHRMPDINCEAYASRVQIKVHQRNTMDRIFKLAHSDGEPYKCKFCSKGFYLLEQLQCHIKVHDANKKYVCEVCGARFIRKTYLDDHKEGHSTEKKHVCKFCGKAFRRRTVLRAHKRVHTHPNYYVCEVCGRAFTNSSTLKTHKLLIHIRERNFKCVICNLTFPLKSTLNKHVLRHQKRENGEKGFNCTQCEMQYRDKSSLKRHIETKHQGRVQLIWCPDCPKRYTSKANLMKHRRRHHNVEPNVISK